MKSIITVFLLIISFSMSAQYPKPEVRGLIERSTYRILVIFSNIEGEEIETVGMGFVIRGQYLATCYHVIFPIEEGFNLKSVSLIYNERVGLDGKPAYDSMPATLDYTPESGQYDFSKHKYNPQDNLTDFVILKLAKQIQSRDLKYVVKNLEPKEQVYAGGNVVTVKANISISELRFIELTYLFYTANTPSDRKSKNGYFALLSKAYRGFSGSPLFDSEGGMVGVIQRGWELYPKDFLDQAVNTGNMSLDDFNLIKNGYEQELRIGFAIDANFLLKNYLKGYL